MPAVMKAALALSLAPMLASATGPMKPAGPSDLYAHIVQVDCAEARGTAFQIEDGRYLTAAHVSSNEDCKINGKPIKAVAEEGLDFAVLEAGPGHGFPINCNGFQTGTYVFGVGYAHGFPWQTMNRMFVTFKDTVDGMRYLLGPQVIPGMSGGPILNSRGEVVGVVNRYTREMPLSYSRALKDTSVCKKA